VIRENHALRSILQFFGVLAVLLSVAALAQMTSAGHLSGKARAVSSWHAASNVERFARGSGQTNGSSIRPLAAAAPAFLPAVTYDSSGSPAYSVAVADVNGDHKPDLLVANCGPTSACGGGINGVLGVLLGNGDGTFLPAVTYGSGGFGAGGVAVADVNGDGKPDLLVANDYYSNTIGVLLGNGDGTFQSVVTYGSGGGGPETVVVADVNGDGRPDLVVANSSGCYACTDGALVGVLLGNGDGTFQPAVAYSSGGFMNNFGPLALVVADLNGDGRLDVAMTNACGDIACSTKGSVGVLLGNGDGTFQPAATYPSSTAGFSVAVADVNGDRKPDLLVVNGCAVAINCPLGTVGVLLGNGDGTFQASLDFSSGGDYPNSIAVSDVNGDGKPDLLVANPCAAINCPVGASGSAAVLVGNGDGTFQAPVIFDSGGYWYNDFIAVADVNGDGKPDLLVVNLWGDSSSRGSVGVLLNKTPFLDTTPPAITLATVPKVLWPPNGKMVPVTISGRITDTGSGVNASSAEFEVHDEYHLVQPHGQIALDPAGNYSFAILLQASRRGNDRDGRRYTIRMSAMDNAGNRGVKATNVTVLHRRPHRKGEDD
jgi:hypothetical protein